MSKTVVITGASRENGIGFSLVKEFSQNGWLTIGSYRDKKTAEALVSLAEENELVKAFKLDVTDDKSVSRFKKKLSSLTDILDVLVNNAGVGDVSVSIVEADIKDLQYQMEVHAIGPIRVTQALLPLLRKSKNKPARVGVMASILASINDVGAGFTFYAPCKTAANALTRQMGSVLKEEGISMFSLHPGWVATDMGGASAPVSSEESAKGLYKVITESGLDQAVSFRVYQGRGLSW